MNVFGNALGDSFVGTMPPTDNRVLLNAFNVAADPDYYASPTPKQSQAMIRQSERDYRQASDTGTASMSDHAEENLHDLPTDYPLRGPASAQDSVRGEKLLKGMRDAAIDASSSARRASSADYGDVNDVRASFGYQSMRSRQLSNVDPNSSPSLRTPTATAQASPSGWDQMKAIGSAYFNRGDMDLGQAARMAWKAGGGGLVSYIGHSVGAALATDAAVLSSPTVAVQRDLASWQLSNWMRARQIFVDSSEQTMSAERSRCLRKD